MMNDPESSQLFVVRGSACRQKESNDEEDVVVQHSCLLDDAWFITFVDTMLALPKIDQQKASGVHLVIKCLVRAHCHRDQARKNNLETAMIMLKESFRSVGRRVYSVRCSVVCPCLTSVESRHCKDSLDRHDYSTRKDGLRHGKTWV